jgi:hypothetical protein
VIHSQFEFSHLGAGPQLGDETAGGQAALVEQRHHDGQPALTKDTDQAQPGGPAALRVRRVAPSVAFRRRAD